MTIELIVDDRANPLHAIRTKGSRRINEIHFHFLKRPFKDSNGRWVTMDRRSGYDRRIY
ncbi:MAG: hypothetical protein GQ549_07570 [Gammaproteobacteria bacterium]|nr:hypothetical protein [Gammaproteobacteria bacterium]